MSVYCLYLLFSLSKVLLCVFLLVEIMNLEDDVVVNMFNEESREIIDRNGYDRGGELDEWLDKKKRELTI